MYNPKKQLPIENKLAYTPDHDDLISTDRVITIAKRLGVSFGHGDPNERIRYFIKLGILPHAIRKSSNSQPATRNQLPATSVGHLPYWVVKRLVVVDRLKKSGLTFPEIAARFKKQDANNKTPVSAVSNQSAINNQQSTISNVLSTSAALWSKLGPSEEEIDRKLAEYKREIEVKLNKHEELIKKEPNPPIKEIGIKESLTKLSESDLNSLKGYQNYLKKEPQPNEPDSKTLEIISQNLSDTESANETHSNLPATSYQQPTTKFSSLKRPIITTAFAAFLILFILLGILQTPTVKQALDKANLDRANQIASEIGENAKKLGAVLAASSEENKLYIDAVTEFLGETTFLDPITAPNIIYSVTGGTGIAVTAGQNPVVSLDSTELVTSVNSTTGALTIAGSGGTSVSTSGSTITISSSSSSSGDITAVNAGNGLTGGASSGDASLAISLTSSGTSTTTSSASGMEFSSGLSLIRGCTNTQTLAWVSATATWDCTAAGGSTTFTLSGDTGTDQTLTTGNTIEIAGGTNGIDTVGTATDTVTLNLDTTEIGTTTFGSGSSIVWTFDAGAADPTIDFNSGSMIFNEAGSDIDLRIEADNNANIFTLDAGLFSGVGQIALGSTAQSTATAFFVVDNPAITATSNQNFYKTLIDNSAAVTITGSTTSSIVASLAIDEPNITATGTVTNAASLYISGAPTEGSSGNFALWVDDGQSRFENTPISGSTTGSALTVVPTYVVEATDITLSGIRLALDSNSNADSGDVFYGLNIDDFTTTSGPTEYGMRIGSGYDYQFYFELGTRDLRISATAPSAGTSPLTATIPALAADDTFCFATLANCFGAGGGAGVTYTSQTTNAITKFTATAGQITSSSLIDDGTTLTLAANVNFTMTAGTGSTTKNFSPAGTTGAARALTITPTFGIDATDQTLSGVYINPNTNSNTDGGDVLNGVLIDTITASSATEYALQIGSGWDRNIYLNDTTTSVLLADGGTITITDGTNTLCTITDGGTTGALNCTGNITGGSGSTVGFWSRSSTTLSPATANDIVSIANTNTTGADLAITNTGVYTGTGIFNLTANSTTTGNIAILSGTGMTTGEILDITGTWAPSDASTNEAIDINITHTPTVSADNFQSINLTTTDGTALANSVYGISNTLTLTGNASKTGYGYYGTVTSSSTTNDTLVVYDATTSVTGIISAATIRNVYGLRSQPAIAAANSAGTSNIFGSYIAGSSTTATTGSTNNVYGTYVSNTATLAVSTGTINNYGVYIANGSSNANGTSSKYGLYIEDITSADRNEEIRLASTTPTIAMTNAGILTFTDGTNNLFDITDGGTDSAINIWGNSGSAQSITLEYQDAGGGNAWLRTIIPVSSARLFEVMEVSGANSVFMVGGSTFGSSFRYGLEVGAANVDTTDVFIVSAGGLGSSGGSAIVATGPTTDVVTDHFVKLASDVGSGSALLNLAPDFSGSIVTAYGLRIAATGPTANANTNYGAYTSLALTGNAAKTGYAYYGTVTSTSTTAETAIYGADLLVDHNAAVTTGSKTLYGLRAQVTNDGITDASTGTHNIYGVYGSATGNTGDTQNAIGVFGTATGGDNNYPFYAGVAFPNDGSTSALCWDNAGASAIVDCTTPLSDYAEIYSVSADVQYGEIVASGTEDVETTHVSTDNNGNPISTEIVKIKKLIKSSGPYQNTIIGITSQNWGDFSSIGENSIKEEDNPMPVALSGRVLLKVSLENGPIKAGDPITSSQTPGAGMRATQAGRIIGYSLEDYNPQTSPGKVMVFVNPSFYMPQTLADDLTNLISLTQTQTQLLTQQADSLHDLLAEDVARAETLLAQLENTHVPTAEEITSLVRDEVDKQLISLGYVEYVATGSAQASSSAQLAAQTNKTLSDLNNLLSTTHLSLNTLSVTGNSQLAQTQVAGTLSQDGTLIIDYGKQINVLGGTLYLQNDSLAGCPNDTVSGSDETVSLCSNGTLLDIGTGLFTFDSQGNLVATGNIEAKGIVLSESTTNSSVGSSQIPTGSSSVTVETSALKPGAKVLVTATGPTGGKSLYLDGKEDYQSFTVTIENGPATNDINFDWLIVNTTQISSK